MKKRFYTRPITVVVSQEMYQQLTELTKQNDHSLCEWIRAAVTIKLENHNDLVGNER